MQIWLHALIQPVSMILTSALGICEQNLQKSLSRTRVVWCHRHCVPSADILKKACGHWLLAKQNASWLHPHMKSHKNTWIEPWNELATAGSCSLYWADCLHTQHGSHSSVASIMWQIAIRSALQPYVETSCSHRTLNFSRATCWRMERC